jgi:hypothetical protein
MELQFSKYTSKIGIFLLITWIIKTRRKKIQLWMFQNFYWLCSQKLELLQNFAQNMQYVFSDHISKSNSLWTTILKIMNHPLRHAPSIGA